MQVPLLVFSPLNDLNGAQRLNGLNIWNGCFARAHVACAQLAGCEFFITCDDGLIRRTAGGGRRSMLRIQVVNPVEFIRTEGSRYGEG